MIHHYSLLFLFLISITAFSQTGGIISQITKFSYQYKYSTIPAADSLVVFWWTPDPANSILHFAAMGAASGYLAFGFNNQSSQEDHMTNGYAVIATNGSFGIYYLEMTQNLRYAALVNGSDQELQNKVFQTIDGYIFVQFDWVLKDPVKFNLNEDQNFIWSLKRSLGLGYHDVGKGFGTINFNNPVDLHPPQINCSGCLYGNCPSGLTFLGPCFCVANYLYDTNCTLSAHKFNHTFYTFDKTVIVEMFWTLSPSGLSIDVRKSLNPTGDINQWFAIGFSQPAGKMVNTDAVLFPDDELGVSAFFINREQLYTGLVPPLLEIRNITSAQIAGSSFFGFTRDLNDGFNKILNASQVYMIAVASNYQTFAPYHQPHNIWSTGADVIDLVSGGIYAP